MAFLVINDFEIPAVQPVRQDPPIRIGGAVRMFAGGLRSTQRPGSKRSWSVTTRRLSPSEAEDLVTAVPDGAFLDCEGALMNEATVLCRVTHAGVEYETDEDSYWQTYQLNLEEV